MASSVLRRLPRRAGPGVPDRPLDGWRSILLVKLVGMGDGVMIRSLAEHLRKLRPDARIGILAGPATLEVMGAGSGFTLHSYDPAGEHRGLLRGWSKVREIRAGSYDVAIDFEQHILLIAFFLWLTRIPLRVGLCAADHPRGRFQTYSVPLSGEDSMWGAYLSLVRLVAPLPRDVSAIPLPCSDPVVESIDRWWGTHRLDGSQVIAMHLGCGSRAEARRWPVERFAMLAERLTQGGRADSIVLTGQPHEQPLFQEFRSRFGGKVVEAMGLGVEEIAELLRRCRLVVSNDTGVMHLAAAMGTATVGLFGPNSPTRYAPVGPRTASVYTTHVPCSPCIHIHRGLVPACFHQEKGRCLLDIEVEDVLAAVDRLLRERSADPRAVGIS